MAKARPPPSPHAIARGRKIKAQRLARQWTQQQLAEFLGVKSREAVSQYESGSIEEIGRAQLLKLIEFGIDPLDLNMESHELRADVKLTAVSSEARRVAYAWDSLPAPLREYLLHRVDSWQELVRANPALGALLGSARDHGSETEHHKRITEYQAEFRANTRKPAKS